MRRLTALLAVGGVLAACGGTSHSTSTWSSQQQSAFLAACTQSGASQSYCGCALSSVSRTYTGASVELASATGAEAKSTHIC